MLGILVIVVGIFVTYKRYMLQPTSTISMHFTNPSAPYESAHVQMHKGNEIRIQRQGNVSELVGVHFCPLIFCLDLHAKKKS